MNSKEKSLKHTRVKRDRLELEGKVVEAYRSATFSVKVPGPGRDMIIMCTLCGKMKENYIKVVPGDKVRVEISPYDTSKGRIVQRIKR